MNNQNIYRDLCSTKKNVPLHLQPWWLDVVYGSDWDVLLAEIDPVYAALPYSIQKTKGFKNIVPPPLSPRNGCWIDLPQNLSPYAARQLENEILTSFARRIDALHADFFLHCFSPAITNWQPFYWQGFSQTTRYTYIIENLQDINLVWERFHKRVRGYIRSLEKRVTIEPATAEEIFRLSEPTYKRQAVQTPYTEKYIQRLFHAAEYRQVSRAIKLLDENGKPVGIHWMVWDNTKAYGVILGHAENSPAGTTQLMLWDQFQFAARQGIPCFDFQGSMMEKVALFNCRMGAEPVPYHCIEKYYSRTYRFLKTLQRNLRK